MRAAGSTAMCIAVLASVLESSGAGHSAQPSKWGSKTSATRPASEAVVFQQLLAILCEAAEGRAAVKVWFTRLGNVCFFAHHNPVLL